MRKGTTMSVDQLRKEIEQYEQALKGKTGKVVAFSENGPANMGLIRALFEVVVQQQREIETLKANV